MCHVVLNISFQLQPDNLLIKDPRINDFYKGPRQRLIFSTDHRRAIETTFRHLYILFEANDTMKTWYMAVLEHITVTIRKVCVGDLFLTIKEGMLLDNLFQLSLGNCKTAAMIYLAYTNFGYSSYPQITRYLGLPWSFVPITAVNHHIQLCRLLTRHVILRAERYRKADRIRRKLM